MFGRFVAAMIAGAAAIRTIGPGRLYFGADRKSSLMGAVIDKIDHHAAELLELLGQVGMHQNVDII